MTTPDPYARSVFHGKTLDNATIAALKLAEKRLGYELTIEQGIGGARASAGTHLNGRAVDLSGYDHERKLRVLKDIGFAVWYRPYRAGVWGAHIHGVLIFESRTNKRGVALSAFNQIAEYDRRGDGLVGDTRDNTYRPATPQVFTLAEYRSTFVITPPPPTNVTKARNKIVESIGSIGHAIAFLDDVDPKRVVARGQMDELARARDELKRVLTVLPAR